MRVMLASNTGIRTGYLAGRFPNHVGHLFSPGDQKGPFEFVPYALDNGAFGAFMNQSRWDAEVWIRLLDWAQLSGQKPLWAICPDVVGQRDATLRNWLQYYPVLARYGWPVAFAVQDGMMPSDVPKQSDVVFIGGTTKWKWQTLGIWCANFPRVHVGRVNSYRRLWQCKDAGVESTDGTGFMRGDQIQYRGLLAFLEELSGARKRISQLSLSEDVA